MQAARSKHVDPITGKRLWHIVGGGTSNNEPLSACTPERLLVKSTLCEPGEVPQGAPRCGKPACSAL